MSTVLNSRGLAYSNKGDDERALADYDRACKLRPNFPAPYNNRGLIFMRKGELQRAYDEFNIALSAQQRCKPLSPISQSRPRADACASNTMPRSPISPKASSSIPTAGRSRPTAASPTPRWANSMKRSPTATRCWRNLRSRSTRWPAAAMSIVAKGDLDAALKDYNERSRSTRISFAPMSAAASFTKSAATSRPRVPTTVPPAPR